MLTMFKVRMSTVDAKKERRINRNDDDNDSDNSSALTAEKKKIHLRYLFGTFAFSVPYTVSVL